MKTKALRQYGKNDLRLEEFELPPINDDELLVKVVCDSLCMSSYKSSVQGAEHKRVPGDIARNPIIVGHEFCGEILEAGARLKAKPEYQPGLRFSIQPAMAGTYDAAGYSFKYLGGETQYAIIPKCYIDQGCILPYDGKAWFHASMAEPMSCVIGAARASYHTESGIYQHQMGIRAKGKMAALAAAGPMGLAFIDYIIHCDKKPSLLVVTDIDHDRLERAKSVLTKEEAERNGVELIYMDTKSLSEPVAELRKLASGSGGGGYGKSSGRNGGGYGGGQGDSSGRNGGGYGGGQGDSSVRNGGGHGGGSSNGNVGEGFDDVFVFAPIAAVVEQADAILGRDGCINFFAGPSDTGFSAKLNYYNVHYNSTHIVGTSGGNTDDMREALEMAASGRINPSILITHIGGLDAARDATLRLPDIPGGKKLIYTHISMPLTAIEDFDELGKTNPLYKTLAALCECGGDDLSAAASDITVDAHSYECESQDGGDNHLTARDISVDARSGGSDLPGKPANHTKLWTWEAERYLLANADKI